MLTQIGCLSGNFLSAPFKVGKWQWKNRVFGRIFLSEIQLKFFAAANWPAVWTQYGIGLVVNPFRIVLQKFSDKGSYIPKQHFRDVFSEPSQPATICLSIWVKVDRLRVTFLYNLTPIICSKFSINASHTILWHQYRMLLRVTISWCDEMMWPLSLLIQVKLSSLLSGSYRCKIATHLQSTDQKDFPHICAE